MEWLRTSISTSNGQWSRNQLDRILSEFDELGADFVIFSEDSVEFYK